MMSPREIVRQIVREGLRRGASDVASLWIRSKSRMVRFSNNQFTLSNVEESNIINTFTSIKGRTTLGSIENIDPEAIKTFVGKLMGIAKLMKLNKDYTPLPQGPFEYSKKKPIFDRKIGELDKEIVDYAQASINAALKEGAKRAAGILTARTFEMWLNTSGDVEAYQRGSSIELSVRAFTSDDASGNCITCSRTLKTFDPEGAGRRAGEISVMAKKPVNVDAGRYKVVLGPYILANLLNEALSSASAFNVDAGVSFFPNELMGKKVASERLTIYDDGIIPEGPSSRVFDDEGVPTQKTAVIRDGVLASLLHNSMTAKKYKTRSTGNAGWISPSPWNLVVEAGTVREEKLLERLDEGLYITNTWYTRFQNYRKGDFSTVCRDGAFRVKSGRILEPVKNLRISDNMISLMKNIEELSRERYWVKWWEVSIPSLLPSAIVRDVGVTKTTK